jgi:ATP-binding cassette, subfamily C (CFTR/MRP), member 1
MCRIVEPTGGSIEMDHVDISKIGLRDLRSRLSLVPQDPVVFSGSLRGNLDPFNERSDADVQAALEQSGLSEWVQGLKVIITLD